MLKTKIGIQNLRFPVHVGTTEAERSKLQTVAFDVQIHFDARISMESDNIEDTVDYLSVEECIGGICRSETSALIEHLVGMITSALFKRFKRAEEVHLKIMKFSTIPNADHTLFEVVARRNS